MSSTLDTLWFVLGSLLTLASLCFFFSTDRECDGNDQAAGSVVGPVACTPEKFDFKQFVWTNAPIIAVMSIISMLLVISVSIIVIFVHRWKNYRPAIDTEKPISELAHVDFQDSIKARLWLIPHIVIGLYLIGSTVYNLYMCPAEERLSIVVTMAVILAIYTLSIYSTDPHDPFWSFGKAVATNLKWLAFLIAAYLVNRIFKGSLKDFPGELGLFLIFLQTIAKILFPFSFAVIWLKDRISTLAQWYFY